MKISACLCTTFVLLVCPSFVTAETHIVQVGNTFDPAFLEVVPGDIVRFEVTSGFGTVRSGLPCRPDGIFSGVVLPPLGSAVEWEVPQFASAELPFFAVLGNGACSEERTALISVVGAGAVRNVPSEHASIQSAIDAASDGDTILIAAGTYPEHDLAVEDKWLTIRGDVDAEGRPAVIIDAQRQGRVLDLAGGDVDQRMLLSNLIVTGGLIDGNGGGIRSTGTRGHVRNCTFVGNESTGFGGGVYMEGVTPDFGACHFTGNTAANGGGVYSDLANPSFVTCVIDQNTATDGLTGGLCQITAGGGKGGPPTGRTGIADSIVCGNVPEQRSGWISASDTCFRDACQEDTDGDGLPDGCAYDADGILNVPDEYPTIQEAIEEAIDGQTVAIAAGTYVFDGDIGGPEPGPSVYLFSKSITITGETNPDGTPAVTIAGLQDKQPVGILVYSDATSGTVIENLRVTNCVNGIEINRSSVTVRNCVFEGNVSCGALIVESPVTMTACVVRDNFTYFAAITVTQISAGLDVSLDDCVIEGNQGLLYGGVSVSGELSFMMSDCSVQGNAGAMVGGMVVLLGTNAVLADTTVCGNLVDGEPGPQIDGDWTDDGGNTISDACAEDCPGDLNGDGVINGADLTMLLGDWGELKSLADIDRSGIVDGADLTLLLGDWGDCSE